MEDLEQVLNGQVDKEAKEVKAEAPEPKEAEDDETKGESEAETETTDEGEAEAKPTESDDDKDDESPPPGEKDKATVPRSALEKVRHEKTDWKEKAIRFEAQLKERERIEQQSQQPQQTEELDPIQKMQNDMLNERFNISERFAREKYSDVDEKLAIFDKAVAENPALGHMVKEQQDPWGYMYKEAEKIQIREQMGDDPSTYRDRLREEIKAELLTEAARKTNEPVSTETRNKPIPKTLASTRSSAPRGSSTETGDTSLDDILD